MHVVTIPTVVDYLSLGLQMSVGLLLALSAWTKIRHPYRFADSVKAYDLLPMAMARPAAALVTLFEVLITVALFTSTALAVALPSALLLFATFLGAVGINLQRRRAVACGCFGDAQELISARTAARLALLVVVMGALWLNAYMQHSTASNQSLASSLETPAGILALPWSLAFLTIGRWLLAWTETGPLLKRTFAPISWAATTSKALELP
jgi:hypothetical protein